MNNKKSLQDFIEENKEEVYFSNNRENNAELIKRAEREIGIPFGKQLKEYLIEYGYLGYKSARFYGINSEENINSDLIENTKYLHKLYEVTRNFIVIEKISEWLYIMVDSEDYVYCFSVKGNGIIPVKLIGKRETLYEHILAKFNCIKTIYSLPKEGYNEEDDDWME